jgi:hypothetical protein
MVHHRQSLPFGFEASDDVGGVHAGLDDLQSELTPDWNLLFRQIDNSEAAFTDLLHQPIWPNMGAGALGYRTMLLSSGRRVQFVRRILGLADYVAKSCEKSVGSLTDIVQAITADWASFQMAFESQSARLVQAAIQELLPFRGRGMIVRRGHRGHLKG